ncbi:MAG: hydrogenase maturation nickel metallochaperone HypA [Gemmatimonadaceae bacterium]|jgi:hydrogenase nickel incorporation protein HypA/HybF|nr:hydrogenase maturation nickel metallochaperone HypA [Gemmatimonadaceae bacterium]MCU0625785.1 hydrogenase maturation nickel metallochaperone HypA [Gemmatimonadaceae bacterium]
MHEASLAQRIAASVAEAVEPARFADVATIHCRVGELSGVQPMLLEAAFGVVAPLTPFPAARLVCESVAVAVHCVACDASFAPVLGRYACPRCGAPSARIVAGLELLVTQVAFRAAATSPTSPTS